MSSRWWLCIARSWRPLWAQLSRVAAARRVRTHRDGARAATDRQGNAPLRPRLARPQQSATCSRADSDSGRLTGAQRGIDPTGVSLRGRVGRGRVLRHWATRTTASACHNVWLRGIVRRVNDPKGARSDHSQSTRHGRRRTSSSAPSARARRLSSTPSPPGRRRSRRSRRTCPDPDRGDAAEAG